MELLILKTQFRMLKIRLWTKFFVPLSAFLMMFFSLFFLVHLLRIAEVLMSKKILKRLLTMAHVYLLMVKCAFLQMKILNG